MPMETAKPQCGGGGTGDAEYDLPLHVIGLCKFNQIMSS